MSDSDSELSSAPAIPSDATLEKALREAVAKVFATNNRDDLTVKRMRTAAEKALDLSEGFFKGDDRWKADSERIIKDEADVQETQHEEKAFSEKEQTPVKAKPKKVPPKPKEKPEKKVAKPKEKPEKKATKPPKRASSDESSKPAKRRKTVETDESEAELSSPPSDVSEEEKPKAKKETIAVKTGPGRSKGSSKPKKVTKAVDSDEDEDEDKKPMLKTTSRPKKGESKVVDSDGKEEEEAVAAPKETKAEDSDDEDSSHPPPEKPNGAAKNAGSDSEMSEVLDPTPKPKRQRRKSSEVPLKGEKKSRKSSKAKEVSNTTPDEAEIKRLQGWLIKCGIRKMWFRELAHCGTPKEKIKHLKGMLTDAGMDGRYSIEKATQIKEARELEADLEMVKEGAKRWGADSDNEEAEVNDKGRPKRKLARGLRNLDFLDSDDGEETS